MAIHEDSKVTIVADIGSCHMGRLDYATEAIDVAADCGVMLKFQLFPDTKEYTDAGNIPMGWDLFRKCWEYSKVKGVQISASIFDMGMLDRICKLPVPFLKFPYSIGYNEEWVDFAIKIRQSRPRIVITSDVMNVHKIPDWCVRLFTIPNQYPVYHPIRWEGIFDRFDGFSDHTLGLGESIRAVQAGATWIERHLSLDHKGINCPDAQFALRPGELASLVKKIT